MILVIFHQLDLTLPLLPIIQILSHQLALHLHHMVLPIGDMGDPKVGDQVSLVDLGLVGLETIGGIDQQDIPDIDLRIPTKRLTIRVTLMVPKIHPQNGKYHNNFFRQKGKKCPNFCPRNYYL